MEYKFIQLLIFLAIFSMLVLPAMAVTNGKIAFVSDRYGINEIFVMNADGSDQTNLTPNQAVGTSPAWSPDGTKIAFRSSDSKIYVMNADGSEKICLTPDIPGGAPLWSPDGNKIAYLAGQHDIYILNADGSGYNALWISGEKNNNLGWSPDSTKIVFNCGYYHTIWVMGADGSNPTHLGHDGQDSGWQYQSPSWSPDGIKIAFQVTDFPNSEIFVVNADWTGRTNLTRNTADDSRPSWSPDGTKIAYYSNVPEGYCNIYVMNPDGSGQTRLASPICSDYVSPYDSSSWSPDSTKIVFTYTPMDSNTEIYVVNTDGLGQKQLTNEGNNYYPSWEVEFLKSAPTFNITPSKIRITDSVQFNASESVNATQDIIVWEFGDGQTDSTGKPVINHRYSDPGSYTVNLTVYDPTGTARRSSEVVNVTIPVVLVHGFNAGTETWTALEQKLEEKGYQVDNFDYGSTSSFIDPRDVADWLKADIDFRRNDLSYNGQQYHGKYDIVCHSMGALVTRWYIEELGGGENVRQWIGVAPVNQGAAAADFATMLPDVAQYLIKAFNKDSILYLRTDSPVVTELQKNQRYPRVKYRVIAGYNGNQDPNFFMGGWIFGGKTWDSIKIFNGYKTYYLTWLGDGIVPLRGGAMLDGVFDTDCISGYDHFMTGKPLVVNLVSSYIENIERPSTNFCPMEGDYDNRYVPGKSYKGDLKRFGEKILLAIAISKKDPKTIFRINWFGSDVNMTLISPSGEKIGPDSSKVITYAKGPTAIYYLVDTSESGQWTAEIDPVDIPESGELFTFSTFSNSSISMNVWTDQLSEYSVGGRPAIYAQITDGSQSIPGATVWSDIQYPDQSLQTMLLYDDGSHGDVTVNDGIYTSSVPLSQSGLYQIAIFTNGTPTNQFERSGFLTLSVTPSDLVANFTAMPKSGAAPLSVQFNDTSTGGLTAWHWEFGDGGNSTIQNATHVYYSAGTFTVNLTVTNASVTDTESKTNYINVTSAFLPLPGFTNPPTDPDSDCLFEDLNANNRKDFNYVVLMFNQMQWIAANEPVSAFDFNGNGRIDFNDIVKLFGEI